MRTAKVKDFTNENIKQFKFDGKLTGSKIVRSEASRDSVTGNSFLSHELTVAVSGSQVTEKLK